MINASDIRNINKDKAMAVGNHNGDNTHHQLQSIKPINFRLTNTTVVIIIRSGETGLISIFVLLFFI